MRVAGILFTVVINIHSQWKAVLCSKFTKWSHDRWGRGSYSHTNRDQTYLGFWLLKNTPLCPRSNTALPWGIMGQIQGGMSFLRGLISFFKLMYLHDNLWKIAFFYSMLKINAFGVIGYETLTSLCCPPSHLPKVHVCN